LKMKGSWHMNPSEQATEWFAHIRECELSDADRKAFSIWLAESPVHVREYLGIAEVWAAVQSLETGPAHSREDLILALHADKGGNVFPLAIADARANIPKSAQRMRPRSKTRRWFISLGIAASVAVFALIAWPNLNWRSGTYRTSRGEQRSIVLSDGSVVQLNTLSTLVIHFDKDRRRVELPQGEALFRVAHDPARPFDVQTPFAVVRAVGTEFNVYNRADSTQVSVIEGKVRIAAVSVAQKSPFSPGLALRDDAHLSGTGSTQGAIPLAAGQQVTMSSAAEPKPIPANASTTTAWVQRRIVLDNDSVQTAVDQFNRYNRVQIHVQDEELANLRISGVFDVDDPQALVKYLEQIQKAHTSGTGTGITLDR
jgi:transmembrane sensor